MSILDILKKSVKITFNYVHCSIYLFVIFTSLLYLMTEKFVDIGVYVACFGIYLNGGKDLSAYIIFGILLLISFVLLTLFIVFGLILRKSIVCSIIHQKVGVSLSRIKQLCSSYIKNGVKIALICSLYFLLVIFGIWMLTFFVLTTELQYSYISVVLLLLYLGFLWLLLRRFCFVYNFILDGFSIKEAFLRSLHMPIGIYFKTIIFGIILLPIFWFGTKYIFIKLLYYTYFKLLDNTMITLVYLDTTDGYLDKALDDVELISELANDVISLDKEGDSKDETYDL